MGKALCFISENMADYEVILALNLLKEGCNQEIATVGYSREPVTSLSGVHYTADLTLAEAIALDDIDVLLLPGGPIVARNEELISFLQEMNKRNVVLAAICYGPHHLARSGLLDGRRYTTSCTPADIVELGIADPFPRAGFVNERVVTDGNIITAQGDAFIDFSLAVVRHIGVTPEDEEELKQYYREITGR
jgi:protein deglycase